MAEISLHKRQRIRLYLSNYVIILFLSNISCLQLCQMFYRGQLCELDFKILDHKQSRRPPRKKNSHQIYATAVKCVPRCYLAHFQALLSHFQCLVCT